MIRHFPNKLLYLASYPMVTMVLLVLFSSSPAMAANNLQEVSIELLASPAPLNSSLSRLVGDQQGNIYLSWVQQENDQAELAFAILKEDRWSEVHTIGEGTDWFVNWADFPMLSVNGDNKVAHWLRMSAQGTYDYNIEATFFDDNSQSWSNPRVIHSDGVNAEHGFVSMLAMPDERTMITWLDGRNTKTEDGYGEMTLRAAVYNAAGDTIEEWELDHRVCDCCQTSSALTADGPIVVYRDRSENEIRDIAVTRLVDGIWTSPATIHNDQWQINGCPVNGPAIAANFNEVAVAWFTANDDVPKVQLALSNDGGVNFSSPIEVAQGSTIGRVDTVILDSGEVVVSWVDVNDAGAAIMLSKFSKQGNLLSQSQVAATNPSRRSGFPIIEAGNENAIVYITWTDISNSPQVNMARIKFN